MSTGKNGDTKPEVDQAVAEMLQIEAELHALRYADRNTRGFPTRKSRKALRLWKLMELRRLRQAASVLQYELRLLVSVLQNADPKDSR